MDPQKATLLETYVISEGEMTTEDLKDAPRNQLISLKTHLEKEAEDIRRRISSIYNRAREERRGVNLAAVKSARRALSKRLLLVEDIKSEIGEK